jgi:hypothetical protein
MRQQSGSLEDKAEKLLSEDKKAGEGRRMIMFGMTNSENK